MAETNIKTTDVTGADQQVVTSDNVEYCGFSLRETSGAAAATVRIHSGTDATGKVLEVVQLPANDSHRAYYELGLEADGIFVDVVAGSVEGSVRWRG